MSTEEIALVKWIRELKLREDILKTIKREEVTYLTEISKRLKVPKSTLQRHIQKMKELELIKPTQLMLDERKVYYRLTRKGEKIYNLIIKDG